MRYIIFFLILFYPSNVFASSTEQIKNKLKETNNMSFKFIQKIGKKTEQGECIISYPKKIFCKYDDIYNKVLVSNGKSLVIKTISSYYIYPLKETPLELILDKKYLIDIISKSKNYHVDENFVAFKFFKNESEVNIFFDKKTLNLMGWQTVDLYQNLNIVFLSSMSFNQKIKKKTFVLPQSD